MMKAGWENILQGYIAERRDMPFSWGSNDCIAFSHEALKRLTGKGYAGEYVYKYKTEKEAARVFIKGQKETGWKEITELIDAHQNRVAFPSRGSLVARKMESEFLGYRIGVCIGSLIAFVGPAGLLFEPVSFDDIAWGSE